MSPNSIILCLCVECESVTGSIGVWKIELLHSSSIYVGDQLGESALTWKGHRLSKTLFGVVKRWRGHETLLQITQRLEHVCCYWMDANVASAVIDTPPPSPSSLLSFPFNTPSEYDAGSAGKRWATMTVFGYLYYDSLQCQWRSMTKQLDRWTLHLTQQALLHIPRRRCSLSTSGFFEGMNNNTKEVKEEY